MKRALKQAESKVVGLHAGITGDVSDLWGKISSDLCGNVSDLCGKISSGMSGNVTGLRGDVTGLRGKISSGLSGDVSGLSGDVDECEITDDERVNGIDISELIILPTDEVGK